MSEGYPQQPRVGPGHRRPQQLGLGLGDGDNPGGDLVTGQRGGQAGGQRGQEQCLPK